MGLETIAIAGLALGAVGQGISYMGQQEAAKNQETFSMLNAQMQQAQASMQGKTAQMQAMLASQQSRNREQVGQIQAQALRSEADQKARASQINIERTRADQARFRSALLARQGSSGTVAGEGSQLDTLMRSAELQALEVSEMQYQTTLDQRKIYRQAEAAQLGADMSGIQSNFDLLEGSARASAYRNQAAQAQLGGLAGVSAARGASLSALGGAIGGFGNLGLRGFDLYKQGAFGNVSPGV